MFHRQTRGALEQVRNFNIFRPPNQQKQQRNIRMTQNDQMLLKEIVILSNNVKQHQQKLCTNQQNAASHHSHLERQAERQQSEQNGPRDQKKLLDNPNQANKLTRWKRGKRRAFDIWQVESFNSSCPRDAGSSPRVDRKMQGRSSEKLWRKGIGASLNPKTCNPQKNQEAPQPLSFATLVHRKKCSKELNPECVWMISCEGILLFGICQLQKSENLQKYLYKCGYDKMPCALIRQFNTEPPFVLDVTDNITSGLWCQATCRFHPYPLASCQVGCSPKAKAVLLCSFGSIPYCVWQLWAPEQVLLLNTSQEDRSSAMTKYKCAQRLI